MLVLGIGALVALILAAPASASDDDTIDPALIDAGAAVFVQACQACHQPGGVGLSGTFPPLIGNANAADSNYVADVVSMGRSGPIEVNGVGYDAEMPAIPLDAADLEAIVAYVVDLAGRTPPPPTADTADAGEPDPIAGEALFLGSQRFSNGGPACFACHAAGSHTQAGAGLGPDLSDATASLGGAQGVAAWLSAPPSQTMQPVFADHPLTAAERANVAAYLATVEGTRRTGVDTMAIGGLVGLAVLLLVMAVVFKGPRTTYVEQLRRRA